MWKDLLKQMIPFGILLAVLWLAAEVLERSMGSSPRFIEYPASPGR